MATEQRKDGKPEAPWERLQRENLPTLPELERLAADRPWDEKDDLWFEAVTGETIPPHERAPRNPDL
jgi:hypothetical protein